MSRMPSVMTGSKRFAKVPTATIPRSTFDRSHGHKTTFDAGYLIPILLDEVLPGDTVNCRMTALARLATPLKPIMDNMYLESFFFAVPYRLLWENWEKFNGAQDDPGDSVAFTIPQKTVHAAGYNTGKLEDYLGVPVGITQTTTGWTHSALPGRAYYLIWNEWFRDENLQDSVSQNGVSGGTFGIGDGPDAVFGAGGSPILRRGKRHDYFTSCLPWQQKGTAIDLPLGAAPVVATGTEIPEFKSGGAGSAASQTIDAKAAATPTDVEMNGPGTWAAGEALKWDTTSLEADNASVITINEMRESFQIQKLLERDARGGTRYVEVVKSHFGVTSPDARVQRPEYLGGGSTPVNVNAVVQQAASDTGTSSQTPQGNLAGFGTVNASGHGFVKSFTEHCIILGLVSVRADITYQQGLDRMFSRETRYDFYWPSFAHLGEQAVYNKEIYLQDHANDELVFGYQERYAEYRYKPSRITGLFRSNPSSGTSLEMWHLSQDFASLPTLGATFIEDDPDIDRCIAVPAEPHFLFDSYFKYVCARPMPVFSIPGFVDHF